MNYPKGKNIWIIMSERWISHSWIARSLHTATEEINKQCTLLPSNVSTLAHITQIQSVITLYKKNSIWNVNYIFQWEFAYLNLGIIFMQISSPFTLFCNTFYLFFLAIYSILKLQEVLAVRRTILHTWWVCKTNTRNYFTVQNDSQWGRLIGKSAREVDPKL